MGLSCGLTIFSEINVPGAYFRIQTTVIDWEAQTIKYVLGSWTSREASKEGKPELPFVFKDIVLELSEGLEAWTKEQQYLMLKNMVPFFNNATDVLEGV